jgi:hypothetical protein
MQTVQEGVNLTEQPLGYRRFLKFLVPFRIKYVHSVECDREVSSGSTSGTSKSLRNSSRTVVIFVSGVGTGGEYSSHSLFLDYLRRACSGFCFLDHALHCTITNNISHYSFVCLGTVTGVSQYIQGCPKFDLPPLNADLYTVAVEPQEQTLITAAKGGEKRGEQGPHKIQGMGAGLVPDVLQLEYIDEVVAVHSDDAMATCKELWMMGIPTGVSSGAIVNASLQSCEQHPNKTAVRVIPSFGERYFTHPMFESIKDQATNMTKQPLPEPYDNTDFGFATPRG